MSDPTLVTGSFGLVGKATVLALADAGHRVVATDLDTPANRRAAGSLPDDVEVRWMDLTQPSAPEALVNETSPRSVIHLAAIIPPFCYANRDLARRVNVDATAALVRAAQSHPNPPRFIQASSIAVYGARNPYLNTGPLTADTPVKPCDIYGGHKVRVEAILAQSDLDWLVLRLGGVAFAEPRFNMDRELLFFEGLLPSDSRTQTVDVRDVAAAFTAATSVDANHEILLIGGDDSHRQLHGELTPAFTAALGLAGVLPPGRPGDPDNDAAWFTTDWMDCTRAQSLLSFQRHSWPDMMAELADRVGWKRQPLKVAAPLVRRYLRRVSPNARVSGAHADPWGAIRERWGDPSPDTP